MTATTGPTSNQSECVAVGHRPLRRLVVPLVGAVAIAVGALLISITSTTVTPAGAAADRSVRTITGTSTGTASGVPDTATISLGADSKAATATAALEANAQRIDGVTKAMLFVGVKESDIQTSNISLYPAFDTRGRISGYTVSTRLTAKTHDVANAGKVIDAAAKLAGDDLRVDNISLSIEDTGPVVRAARTKAVTAAHDQAAQLARAAHVDLGRVRSIVEERDSATPVFQTSSADLAHARANIPVSPGTQDLQIRVTVVYEIR